MNLSAPRTDKLGVENDRMLASETEVDVQHDIRTGEQFHGKAAQIQTTRGKHLYSKLEEIFIDFIGIENAIYFFTDRTENKSRFVRSRA